MAGTSRKNKVAAERRAVKERDIYSTEQKTYSVGIYARLSVDSHSEKNDSIENQIEIARSYLEMHPDMVLFDCYSDLGKTGTNFEREGFNRLMADVRSRKVDCIIVKDFSRFGRNYIEAGNYIQKIFPFLGVRFISVTDSFDSLREEGDTLGINLKNLANEMYARDIAVKVKSARKAQWEKGSYTGGLPPYGYRAEWIDGKKYLFVEPITADIVKELYCLYVEGRKMPELVKWLYERKVHRPKDYHKYGHVIAQEGEELQQWTVGSVKIILTNPVYMGCLVQARTCGKDYRLRKRHDIQSEDWVFQEHTHEAIITEDIFFRIAERFEKQEVYCNKSGYSKTIPAAEDILKGVLFCGECGRKMERSSYTKQFGSGDRMKLYGYYCRRSTRIDGLICESKYMTAQVLEQLLRMALKTEFSLSGMKTKNVIEQYRESVRLKQRGLHKELRNIQKEIDDGIRKGSELYLQYRNGEIEKEDFLEWKEKEDRKSRERKERLEAANRKLSEADAVTAGQERFLRALVKFNEKSELDKEMVETMIERISVFPDRRVEIKFRFYGKDFEEVLQKGKRTGGCHGQKA